MDLSALLAEIKRFCDKNEMAPSRFGRLAVKDCSFVFAIENGKRSPTLRTVNTVILFMKGYGKNDRGSNKTAAYVDGRHAKK